jgi:hypothetical protein
MQSRNTSVDAIMSELMRGNMTDMYGITDTQYNTLIDNNQNSAQAGLFESITSRGERHEQAA